ncbi:MAG: hypothetical protein Q7J16_10395 [Candidatus Cloacimonadales bacterium]|nr:hypothetical protein [Candidatus Cloacimonadales bacterium]
MATANFHNINASCVFSYELEDEFDYEGLVANLESELAVIACDYRFNGFLPNFSRKLSARPQGQLIWHGWRKNGQPEQQLR